jgi:hypothetical protein
MTHMTISAVLLLCFHTYKKNPQLQTPLRGTTISLESNSVCGCWNWRNSLSASLYTVTKDCLVVASRWKIQFNYQGWKSPLSMRNMFPTTNRVFFTFPHACRKSLLVPGRKPLTFSHGRKVFWSLEQDMF